VAVPGELLMGVGAAAAGGSAQSSRSLSFSGGRVDTSVAAVSAPWSLSCWVKQTASQSGYRAVFAQGLPRGFYVKGGVPNYYDAGDHLAVTTLASGTWYHLGLYSTAGTLKFYVNGSLDQTLSTTVNGFPANTDIGSDSGGNNFDGLIDDVALWSVDRSADMAGLAAGTTDPATLTTGLLALWRLEEGSGTTTADASGNGNTGTLTGGVTWSSDVPAALA
jgi:hypothetical protein